MIKKLRIKFIVLSMLAVLVLLAVIVAAMNIINYNSVVNEADEVLMILSENKGAFPQFGMRDRENMMQDDEWPPEDMAERPEAFDEKWKKMSPETPYESRFFFVVLDETGEATQINIKNIMAVDEEQAVVYAKAAVSSGKIKGFTDGYRYSVNIEDGSTRVIFLDYGRKIDSFNSFMLISILMGLLGYLLFFIVIAIYSKRIVKPVAESYEKQKRFITDAGHEIKTPLTIIKADADILEMDVGENEWITDIQKQTDRLTTLTNDLIYLARTEEASDQTNMIEFPMSDLTEEVVQSFQGPARSQNKNINACIEPMVSINGDEKKIGQLIGIFIDNALKYSPENTDINVSLEKQGKNTVLSVSNETTDIIDKESLGHLFDRFYRVDSSRNSKTGGYGIGLSMAKAIVEAHGGKIQAKTETDNRLKMIVTF